jgi:hypothetical protein
MNILSFHPLLITDPFNKQCQQAIFILPLAFPVHCSYWLRHSSISSYPPVDLSDYLLATCLHPQPIHFNPEDGGSIFLWNHILYYMVSQAIRSWPNYQHSLYLDLNNVEFQSRLSTDSVYIKLVVYNCRHICNSWLTKNISRLVGFEVLKVH